jgi:hypothetical protein
VGAIFLCWHPINCLQFPTKKMGAVFHQISEDFYPSDWLEFFFAVYNVKKHAVSRKKTPRLLMVFLIIRDALFSRDKLFPITFFSV